MQEIKLITEGGIDWYSIIIPSAVTIIGFIVNLYLTKSSIKQEILKIQKNLMIEKNVQIMEFFLKAVESPNGINITKFQETMNLIYSYGSNDLIRLFGEYQQFNYAGTNSNNYSRMFAFYTLILSQIKYDLTGEVVKPSSILKIKIKDFYTTDKLDNYHEEINLIIEKLKLNKDFSLNSNFRNVD